MSRRRSSSRTSPAAPTQLPPLEDENLLWEILLRLPPLPSSLPRASLVCKRWLGVVSDHGFLRNLRAHHKKPPLLGFVNTGAEFFPTLDPPDRIPAARFFRPQSLHKQPSIFLDCRHGLCLGLIYDLALTQPEAVVWDPITSHHRQIALPLEFAGRQGSCVRNGAVLCAAGHGRVHSGCSLSSFKLVFLCVDRNVTTVSACLYDSDSGVWGSIISKTMPAAYGFRTLSILAGNTLCWLSEAGTILEYDLENQRLGVIERPEKHQDTAWYHFHLLHTHEDGIGLAVLTGSIIEIWVRKVNYDGAARLMLQKTLELHKLLAMGSLMDIAMSMVGFDEDDNAIILSVGIDDTFMVNIKSLQVRKFACFLGSRYPYRNFWSAAGGGHRGTETTACGRGDI